MVGIGHEPEWPDKVMTAALMVVMSGLLGIAYVLFRWMEFSVGEEVPEILHVYPNWATLIASAWALVFGVIAYRKQASSHVMLGMLGGVMSLGFLGASSLLALLAIWPLVRAYFEGEETIADDRVMHADEWPDKAIMASVLLSSAGVLYIIQALFHFADRIAPIIPPNSHQAWGVISIFVGIFCIYAGRQAFHLRSAAAAWGGAMAAVFATGFYFAGPALGVAAMVYLGLAGKEEEFETAAT